MSVFDSAAFDQHEMVVFGRDERAGLSAIIAIHNTHLGPAAGGCRMYPYADSDTALSDVLRLSRGMTYKSALADLPFGGGKSIIIGDPKKDKTPALLRAMGAFIDSLGGKYIAAEDAGTGVEDMQTIKEKTPYVSGVDNSAKHLGDPSPSTALGVFTGIQVSVRHKLGLDELSGVRIALQGVGHVGYYLTELLTKASATVFVADINKANVQRVVKQFGATEVASEDIIGIEAEVFCPCAMGAVINDDSIQSLNAPIVAGAANNQLAADRHAQLLLEKDILYAPDFVINAGGIIDVYYQTNKTKVEMRNDHILRIGAKLVKILERSDAEGLSSHLIAEAMAEQKFNLLRTNPIDLKLTQSA